MPNAACGKRHGAWRAGTPCYGLFAPLGSSNEEDDHRHRHHPLSKPTRGAPTHPVELPHALRRCRTESAGKHLHNSESNAVRGLHLLPHRTTSRRARSDPDALALRHHQLLGDVALGLDMNEVEPWLGGIGLSSHFSAELPPYEYHAPSSR